MRFLNIRCLLFLSLLAIISCTNNLTKKEQLLFKNLDKGTFDVGYKSMWKLDTLRPYRFVQDSTVISHQSRPILFNIWYPIVKAQGKAMQYGEYFNIHNHSDEFAVFSRVLRDFNLNVVAKELLDQRFLELDSLGAEALNLLFKKQTIAHKDEPFPIEGTFPLVIYHSGAQSSFEDNSVLCEFLASYGYVVIGSAYQKADGSTLSVDAGEGSFKDIDFLIKEAKNLSFINASDLTLIGHSLGAQTLLKYQSKGLSSAKALIPIDATFEYHSKYNDLYWSEVIHLVKSNKDQFNNRLLAISEYTSFYQLYETLELADRYYLSIGHITHNEFIAQGIIKKWINSKYGLTDHTINESYDAVSRKYAFICKTILDFISEKQLNTVRSDAMSINFESHLNEDWNYKQSTSPTPREHFNFYQEKGVNQALEILKQHEYSANSNPLYTTQYGFSWVFDLLSQNRISEAKKVEMYFNRFNQNGIKEVFKKKIDFGKKYEVELIVSYFERKLKLLEH